MHYKINGRPHIEDLDFPLIGFFTGATIIKYGKSYLKKYGYNRKTRREAIEALKELLTDREFLFDKAFQHFRIYDLMHSCVSVALVTIQQYLANLFSTIITIVRTLRKTQKKSDVDWANEIASIREVLIKDLKFRLEILWKIVLRKLILPRLFAKISY